MGEAKRRKAALEKLYESDASFRDICEALTREGFKLGKPVEYGFLAFQHLVIPKDAPSIQIEEMRKAFFAGAQHIFASLTTVIGVEPDPESDMRMMEILNNELEEYAHRMALDLELMNAKPKGNA